MCSSIGSATQPVNTYLRSISTQSITTNTTFFQQQRAEFEGTELYKAYKEDEGDYMHMNKNDRFLTLSYKGNVHSQKYIESTITPEFFSDILISHNLKPTKYLLVTIMNCFAQALIMKELLDAYNIVFTQMLQLINEATFVPVQSEMSKNFYNEIFLPAGLVNTEEGNKQIVNKVGFKSPKIKQYVEDKLKKAAQFRKYEVATLLECLYHRHFSLYSYELYKNESKKNELNSLDKMSEEEIVKFAKESKEFCPTLLEQCVDPTTEKLKMDIDLTRTWFKKTIAIQKGIHKWGIDRRIYQQKPFFKDPDVHYDEHDHKSAAVYQNNQCGGKTLGQGVICARDVIQPLPHSPLYKRNDKGEMRFIGLHYVNNVIEVESDEYLSNGLLNPYAPPVFISCENNNRGRRYVQMTLRTNDNEPDKVLRLRPVNPKWWKLNIFPEVQKELDFLRMCLMKDMKVRKKRKEKEIEMEVMKTKRKEMDKLSNGIPTWNIEQFHERAKAMVQFSEEIKRLIEEEKNLKLGEPFSQQDRQFIESNVARLNEIIKACEISTQPKTPIYVPAA
jgi:hypothetical protein